MANLATRHLDFRSHLVVSDEEGIALKAYENDGVPFPATKTVESRLAALPGVGGPGRLRVFRSFLPALPVHRHAGWLFLLFDVPRAGGRAPTPSPSVLASTTLASFAAATPRIAASRVAPTSHAVALPLEPSPGSGRAG